jgi:hypothetical protein
MVNVESLQLSTIRNCLGSFHWRIQLAQRQDFSQLERKQCCSFLVIKKTDGHIYITGSKARFLRFSNDIDCGLSFISFGTFKRGGVTETQVTGCWSSIRVDVFLPAIRRRRFRFTVG